MQAGGGREEHQPRAGAAGASNGASNPASAQMATPNLTPECWKTASLVVGVDASSPSPRCRLRCTPTIRPAAAKTWVMYGAAPAALTWFRCAPRFVSMSPLTNFATR